MSQVAKLITLWYLSIFLTVEILSYFKLLDRSLFLCTQIIIIIALFKLFRPDLTRLRQIVNLKSKTFLIMSSVLFLTFIQGFFSAPSTTDSMVYHLPRVMHWIQDKTVDQDIIRNEHDFMAPFGEYIVLSLYLILNSDRLAFFSQWIAFVGIIYLSGSIAAQLGANKKQVNYIRLLVTALPIALMQSVSTQVDLVVTVLLVIAVHLSLILRSKFTYRNIIILGLILGFGVLTKATFMIYSLIPVGIIIYSFKNHLRKIIFSGVIILILISVLTGRFFIQNYNLYGNLLGEHILADGEVVVYTNQSFSLQTIFSNTLRNLIVQIPIPFFANTGEGLIRKMYLKLNLNINDPLTTCCGEFKVLPIIYPQEDIVSNPLHLFLIFLGIIYFFKIKKISFNKIFFSLVIFSFFVFSTIIKWQPFHSRLEIPFFVFGIIGGVLLVGHKEKLLKFFTTLSIVIALVIILLNVSRPYISYYFFYDLISQFSKPNASTPQSFFVKLREQQYFNARYYWYKPYEDITTALKVEKNPIIALDLMDHFEYPVWVMMKDKGADFKIVSKKEKQFSTFLIKTSESEESVEGFEKIYCIRTEVEYGLACLYKNKLSF